MKGGVSYKLLSYPRRAKEISNKNMVAKGCRKPEDQANWLTVQLARARLSLSSFPKLQSLVENFKILENERSVENEFFYLCIYPRAELRQFEEFLTSFNVLSWDKERLDHLKRRASGNDRQQSISALMEGLIARHYAQKPGFEVEPSPKLSNGKIADLKVNFENKAVFIEMTALGTRQFEERLEKVYERVCDKILSSLARPRWVGIVIEPTRLPVDDEGHLDVERATSLVEHYIERLNLPVLFYNPISISYSINFDDIQELPEKQKSLYDHRAWTVGPHNMLELYDFDLSNLVMKEPVTSWARTVTPEMAEGCPIVYFVISEHERPIVHIGTKHSFPSRAAELERKAFLSHLTRRVRDKLSESQRDPGAANILVVWASNWLYHGYDRSEELHALGFKQIEDTLNRVMEEIATPELSCIKLYEWDYERARIIANPRAREASTLSDRDLQVLA